MTEHTGQAAGGRPGPDGRRIGRRALGALRRGGAAGALALLMIGMAAPGQAQTAKEKELETRVEQLERTVRALSDELKATRDAAKDAAEKAAAAQQAVPPEVTRSGKKGVTLTVSGQVDRGVLVAHDGHDTEVFHVDNNHSSTRVRFVGKGDVNKDLEVGAQIEVEIESNSTGNVSQINQDTGTATFADRIIEVFAKHKRYGALAVGQGPTASDSSAELDLTDTNLILKSSVQDFAGGLFFRFDGAPNALSPNQTLTPANPTINGSFNNFDGLARRDRARYDSPSLWGFTVSGSAASEGAYDGALRYKGKHGDMRVVGAFAAANDPQGGSDRNVFSGSASVLHEGTGLGLTAAAGCRDSFGKDRGCADQRFWYLKGGWQWDIFDFGRTHFAVDYYDGHGISQRGERSAALGAAVIQHIDEVATELYLGVRNYSLDRSGGDEFDDIFAVLSGARVKF